MEELQLKTLEPLQKIRPSLNLRISNQGEIDLQGDIATDDLQIILDASYLKTNLYLEHQKQLDRESNLMVFCIGLIFSTLVGLICFCALNQSPKYQNYRTYQHSQRIQNNDFNG